MDTSSTSPSSSTPHLITISHFGTTIKSLHEEMDKIKLGILTAQESNAHQLALDLFEKAKEIKRGIIREISNPEVTIDRAFAKCAIPTSRALALAEILGRSEIQHDDELKRTLSLTTTLFWELVGFQLSSQSRRIYKTDVDNLRKLLENIFATLPKDAVETKFALKCFEATVSRLSPGQGKVKEVFKDHAQDILKGALECALSRNDAPAVAPLLNLAVRIYREIPLRWYRHTWLLNWGKEVTTRSEFDQLAAYVVKNEEESKAYFCFVNVIYDILASSDPSQVSMQGPVTDSSIPSQTPSPASSSVPTTASSSAPHLADLKTYAFSGHELSLIKLAEKFPKPNLLLKWREKRKDRTFFDKYWKARYLCMVRLKDLIKKDSGSFKTREVVQLIGRRIADKEEKNYVRDAALEALQFVPADTAIDIAVEAKLCSSGSPENIQREFEATKIALIKSQQKAEELESRLQEISARKGVIDSQPSTSGEQLQSTRRQAQGADSDTETSDDDHAELIALQEERTKLLAEEEEKIDERNKEVFRQENLEVDLKIQEYLTTLLGRSSTPV